MTKWTLLATNDDVTTCECCGKSNLKMTVVMTDGEREVYYGRDCAARALSPRFPMTATQVERAVEKAAADRDRAARNAEWEANQRRINEELQADTAERDARGIALRDSRIAARIAMRAC